MNKRHVFYVGLVLLAVMALFGAPMTASAVHPDVTLKQSTGVTVTGITPYSTKVTCGGCHYNVASGAYSEDRLTWAWTSAAQVSCVSGATCTDYASFLTSQTSHSHGYPNNATPAATVSFMTYQITEAAHGASTGVHSQHGRNENLTAAQRTIWGAPAFISGTGMSGRY